MNKQELINGLGHVRYNNPKEEHNIGYNEGIDTAVRFAKRLNESEKPVVPQYVADFFESIREDSFEYKLYQLCILYKDNSDELSDEIWAWFDDNDNEALQTLVKMKLFGYEIEKERLYTVEVPNPNSEGGKLVLFKQQTTGRLVLDMLTPSVNKPEYIHLTESEIKKDFDWAWQFAKEVEG